MPGNRKYMVGTNLPGCLPDTTDPLPMYDTEEEAIKALYDEVDKTVGDAVAEGKMSEEEAHETLASVKHTTITKLLALGQDDQFTVTCGGRVHFVHLVLVTPTTDNVEVLADDDGEVLDPIRETTLEHLVDLINFTRQKFQNDAHSRVCAERNGLVFAILCVAGVEYDEPGELRPTRAWQNMHSAVRGILDGQIEDPIQGAKWILDAAQSGPVVIEVQTTDAV